MTALGLRLIGVSFINPVITEVGCYETEKRREEPYLFQLNIGRNKMTDSTLSCSSFCVVVI